MAYDEGERADDIHNAEERQRFWDELKITVDGYGKEQQFRLKGEIPQYEPYCDYRYGSSCMGQVVAMTV